MIRLPYTDRTIEATLSTGTCLGTLDIKHTPPLPDESEAVRQALRDPIGNESCIFDVLRPGERVAVVVSDSFRQTRADVMVPVLLEGLQEAGIGDESLKVIFSTGTHRGPTADEQQSILGPDIYNRLRDRIEIHDAWDDANLVSVGTTQRGTPVEINRTFHESDRTIVTGTTVFHYFGGYGGGRKSVVPGLASAHAIAHNHAMNLDPSENRLNPAVRIGQLEGNPVAEDMLEASKMTEVDCILNTVLNREGRIAGVFAGKMESAHEAACEFARHLFAVHIDRRADLVIAASANTRNFVQTHKALYNAWQATADGGRIVLAAPCPEGLGGEQFTKWLDLGSREQIFEGLRRQSEINGQTALSSMEKTPSTVFISEMTEASIARLGGTRANTLQEALDRVTAVLPDDFTYYVMPSAAYTVPFVSK